MKVLWFSNSPAAAYNDGIKGTGGWMVTLDHALQSQVELHVSYLYPYKQVPFQNGQTTYHPIYSGHILLKRFSDITTKNFLADYLRVIEEVKPDIIHIHGSENTFHSILSHVNIPVVLSVQGNLTVYAQKYLSGFHGRYLNIKRGRMSIKSLILGRQSYQDGWDYLQKMSKIEQQNLLQLKYVIGRTDWDYRITRILAPDSTYFVCNEMLRDSFYTNEWHNPYQSGRLVIHTTNGDNYYKGFETLCHALHLLNGLGLDVEWRVAGVSEDSAINQITKKYLKQNYPQKGLRLMGSLDENGLVDSLLSSHLYVMPSHIENSPNNLCEAMILGLPCIATHAGGTASILENRKEGILIQDGDPWVMAGAVVELMRNPLLAVQYGQVARERAQQRHDRERIVQELLSNYRMIIQNNK